jgi:outer membrane protein TolC
MKTLMSSVLCWLISVQAIAQGDSLADPHKLAAPSSLSSFLMDLERIRSKSFAIQAEQERRDSVSANAFAKSMFWTPSLSVGVGRSKLNSPTQPSSSYDYDYWRSDATWNLFRGGGDLDQKRAADLQERAAELKLKDETLKLELKASSVVFHQLYLKEVIHTTQNLVKLREESHRIVSEKFQQGRVPLQEVTKSEVDRSQQRTRLRSLESERLQNQAQWKALLNEGLTTGAWPLTSHQKLSLEIILERGELTPAVKSLESLSLASERLWRSARSGHWPSLDLTASYQESPLKERGAQAFSQQVTAGLQLTLPLWSQYETSNRVAQAYAEHVAARSRFQETQREEEAQREVLSARVELARQNLIDAQANLSKSEKLYQDMLKSFRFGRMSMNELLIEQNRLIESQMSLSQSQWDFHKVLMEACAAAGLSARACLL